MAGVHVLAWCKKKYLFCIGKNVNTVTKGQQKQRQQLLFS